MAIKGTQSEKNLQAALAGESIARNKYSYFAMVARKEGLDEIADAFEDMAKNEMTHARLWYEQLYGKPGDTMTNLQEAAKGEYSEWKIMYPEFAKQAREDGDERLAVMFEKVAAIEQDHEMQFMMLFAQMMSQKGGQQPAAPKVQERTPVVKHGFRCTFCGAVYSERPDVCGVCQAIGSFDAYTYTE